MNLSKPSPLVAQYNRLRRMPAGSWLFSKLVSRSVPFTKAISPRVLELTPGFAKIAMHDRGSVRNHVGSIHACALSMLGELNTGLALLSLLPRKARTIAIRMEVDFLKKAKGDLSASCECPPVVEGADQDLALVSTLRDATGDEVARVTTHWRIGMKS